MTSAAPVTPVSPLAEESIHLRSSGRSRFIGAMFLMATSAIGPGFLTQTTVFTDELRAAFAFAILASVLWVAARRRDLLDGYRYPRWLVVVGIIAWVITVYLGYELLTTLGDL